MTIKPFYVTFGLKYRPHPEPGAPTHPLGMNGSGWATIEAPNVDVARGIALAVFDTDFAFLYDEPRSLEMYPEGELLRIEWNRRAPGHHLITEPVQERSVKLTWAECECSNHDSNGEGGTYGYFLSPEDARLSHQEHIENVLANLVKR